MSKPTPGPWRLVAEGADAWVVCPDGRRFMFGDILYHPENVANARLASAAPELLGACLAAQAYDSAVKRHAGGRSWVTSDELDRLYDDWIAKARAAVTKAEGKDSP